MTCARDDGLGECEGDGTGFLKECGDLGSLKYDDVIIIVGEMEKERRKKEKRGRRRGDRVRRWWCSRKSRTCRITIDSQRLKSFAFDRASLRQDSQSGGEVVPFVTIIRDIDILVRYPLPSSSSWEEGRLQRPPYSKTLSTPPYMMVIWYSSGRMGLTIPSPVVWVARMLVFFASTRMPLPHEIWGLFLGEWQT